MDLTLEPDLYSPSINKNGDYIDVIPSFNYGNGFYCPCGSRKDKIYNTKGKLSAHTRTKCHQNWLKNINLNKKNHYAESIKLSEIVKNQKIIIAEQSKQISNKILTIDFLTEKLMINENKVKKDNIEEVNLIDLN